MWSNFSCSFFRCDADPEALAKYVYALVRKDKSIDALREGMVEQLDVFLQKGIYTPTKTNSKNSKNKFTISETKPFVELLFKTLEKQEYIQPPVTIPNANPPNPNIPTPVTPTRIPTIDFEIPPIIKDPKPVIPVSSLPDLEPLNGTTSTTAITPGIIKAKEVIAKDIPATGEQISQQIHKKDHKKIESDDNKVIRSGRIRHRSTSRNRSRSRSWERTRRSRSRDNRSREREQRRDRSRPWRNKSPPRRYDRRRSPRSNSPIVQRMRSPRHNYRGRYRNRSPPRSHSRSRSRSPGMVPFLFIHFSFLLTLPALDMFLILFYQQVILYFRNATNSCYCNLLDKNYPYKICSSKSPNFVWIILLKRISVHESLTFL